ncbi:alpha-xylosidase [Pseudalkalibacillus salsuginis]|uniref:alpha-xylosidase n=1 Tax=Pseudalkalibacillus salsuginis TaxID=2910972 RepID=UPI001F3DD871|nr:alpha-xylosidase [Pseudalkalibacillus salsuginis]MCF6409640.1 alpha-xylosidase [Pseudalkalibacillus salsuginis]
MKFTDGFWLVKEGFDINFAREIRDIQETNEGLTLYAPCKAVRNREDTLNIPQLTIHLSAPSENVIRVQAYHHKGTVPKKPNFDVLHSGEALKIEKNEQVYQLTSGDLHVNIQQEGFGLEFFNQEGKLTHVDPKGFAWITDKNNESYMRAQLNLGVGEHIYGLGERFTPFVKNGQVVDTWNKDGGTSSEQSYKNIPFYLSNHGYGVFVNHPEEVNFEIGSEAVSKTQFSVRGEMLDYYIINGPTLKDVLRHYTNLTGKPALPPAWSFGLWLTTSFTTDYTEETVNHFIDGMAERDIPLRVFHFDCFWMKEFEWCNFVWDTDVFPEPEAMIKRLKDKGLKICLWINPYIAQKSPVFDEAAQKGYLLKKENGDLWQWDLWQAGMGIVDFTNPDASKWYEQKLKNLLDMGVDCFKTDFGERIPTNVTYHNGSDPQRMHNYYAYQYNQVVFDLLKREKGEQEAVVFARSSAAGGQKFPVHWGGDCDATYESMAESLRGGLSLTLSGFGYWSHDIGGFENTATPDVFKRWTAFGLLTSHSRLHGSSSYRVPWLFDEEAVEVTRHFTKLKNRLMPYLYSTAVENHQTGIPVMRAMLLEFPDDPTCDVLDRQYMLGDSIMVAPVFREDGLVSYYLPKGTWTHLLTGEVVEGGLWKKAAYDYMSLPLYVRENSILTIGSTHDKPDYDYEEDITFQVYQLQEGKTSSTTLVDTNGETIANIEAVKDGNVIHFKTDMSKPYSILLVGFEQITSVSSGSWKKEENGVRIEQDGKEGHLSITL